MRKYEVSWSKTYYVSGTEIVEAEDGDEAETIVREKIADLEGSLQWNPDEDYVEAY